MAIARGGRRESDEEDADTAQSAGEGGGDDGGGKVGGGKEGGGGAVIPSLTLLCMERLIDMSTMESSVNSYRLLSFCSAPRDSEGTSSSSDTEALSFVVDSTGYTTTSLLRIREKVRSKIGDIYPAIKERYGEEGCREILGDDFDHFNDANEARLAAARSMAAYRAGKPIEKTAVEIVEGEVEEGFYPLRALVKGVAWPTQVDPAKREQFLSPSEFESVFKMSKETFNSLDKFKRADLKKKHDLW